MTELVLVVPQEVALGVQDSLGLSRRAARVIELSRIVGGRVDGRELVRGGGHGLVEIEVALGERVSGVEHGHSLERGDAIPHALQPGAVVSVGDQNLGLGVGQPMGDPVISVEL